MANSGYFGGTVDLTLDLAKFASSELERVETNRGKNKKVGDKNDEKEVENDDISSDREYQVTQLARKISRDSESNRDNALHKTESRSAISRVFNSLERRRTGTNEKVQINPFIDTSDPQLDPNSDKFNPKLWAKSLFQLFSRDPDRYPTRTAGVSFSNLGVYGFGSDTDFQKNVLNIWIDGFNSFKSLFGGKTRRRIQILREFDGLVKSGEMLVVLGRPGSGCSTLLKTLSGETFGLNLEEGSNIQYQGVPYSVMQKNYRGETMYQAEVDVHFPQLTVGQTLTFAALARTPRNRIPGVTREQYAEHMRDVVMAVFGISHTLNTKVGNDYVRGVSGGERKRVSIAEALLSLSPLQCWDNSTRGLDSASALEFVKTLKLGSDMSGSTCIVSLYQASQSAYDMFDKVTVLYEGRQIYFGPTKAAKEFFIKMGYTCPDRQTTGDFLTSLTNSSERIVTPGFEKLVPRTPDEFQKRWHESDERKQLLLDIEAYEKEFPEGGEQLQKFKESRNAQKAKGVPSRSPYTISIPMQIRLCITRGFQRMKGDKEVVFATVFGNNIMALIVGSVFFHIPEGTNGFFSRGSVIFFAVLLNAFASGLEILTLYQQRPIVEKHDKYALYFPFSEAVSSMLVDMPVKIVVAVFFNIIIYFMANLRQSAGSFFIFFLFSFSCTLTMSMIFRTIGASTRTMAQAMAPAAVFMLMLIIYTGFALPIAYMHPWFRWLNYLNPIGYAFESLMINEFQGRVFPCSQFVPAGPGYENISGKERICSVAGAVAGNDFVSGTEFIVNNYRYYPSHLWRNLGIMYAFMVFFLFTYLWATEKVTAQPSKGEVLVFKRGYEPKKKVQADEEEVLNGDHKPENHDANEFKIQKQTDIFQWTDVCIDVKVKGGTRRLLNKVDGWVQPGALTALMGVSGAGKTTLLDVLASRATMGVITGDMLVNGKPRDSSFQRKTGYVQQQDLHLQTTTVREALEFSALMRQPDTFSREEKLAYVEEVIQLLEMEEFSEAVVGVLGEGLNVEQRKRLTIGVELAAKPELLLFFDEPTSGLDSQTAWSICCLMRKLAESGQAILCTIHQPSAMLLQQFDKLLFLAAGGRTVYFGHIGENSSTLINYFESNGGTPCPRAANPAEWMMEVIGAAPGSNSEIDWPEVWNASPEKAAVRKELERMRVELSAKASDSKNQLDAKKTFAVGFWTQLYHVFIRVNLQYWRTPSYIYSKLFLGSATSLFIGFSFWKAGTSLQGLQNQLFSIFMLYTTFANIVQQIMPNFVTQRALYEVRERPSKTYSWQAFMVANILVEIPWQTLMAVITFFCYYYPVGLQNNAAYTNSTAERGGLMFLLVWVFYIFSSTFAYMMIAGIETAETGANISNLLFSLCLVFCGVLATPEALPGFWIFMYRVSPFTYLVSAMLSTGVANAPVVCSEIELSVVQPPSGMDCGQYLKPFLDFFGGYLINGNATSDCKFCSVSNTNTYLAAVNIFYHNRWRNLGFLFIYIVFNIFAALFIYWLARVPKEKKAKKSKKE